MLVSSSLLLDVLFPVRSVRACFIKGNNAALAFIPLRDIGSIAVLTVMLTVTILAHQGNPVAVCRLSMADIPAHNRELKSSGLGVGVVASAVAKAAVDTLSVEEEEVNDRLLASAGHQLGSLYACFVLLNTFSIECKVCGNDIYLEALLLIEDVIIT